MVLTPRPAYNPVGAFAVLYLGMLPPLNSSLVISGSCLCKPRIHSLTNRQSFTIILTFSPFSSVSPFFFLYPPKPTFFYFSILLELFQLFAKTPFHPSTSTSLHPCASVLTHKLPPASSSTSRTSSSRRFKFLESRSNFIHRAFLEQLHKERVYLWIF